jgi:hypothetical protein
VKLPKILRTGTGCRIDEEYIYPGALCDCGEEAVAVAVVRYQSNYGVRFSYTVMALCQGCSEEYMIQEWNKEAVFLSIAEVFQRAEEPLEQVDRKVYERICYNGRQGTILDWIQQQEVPPDARQLAARFGGQVDTLRKVLDRWSRQGHVEREARYREGTGVLVMGYRVLTGAK